MKQGINNEVVVNAEAFAVATQVYVRLRRVCSRVIDVMYLVHDKEYARYIIEVATATKDMELAHYAERLSDLLDLYPEPELPEAEQPQVNDEDSYFREVTEEEIYHAQISHHYIGALR